MILRPGERSYPELNMETRARKRIPNAMRRELHPKMLAESVELWKKAKPNARLRSITGTYNCIGMVVACRRTWVDTEELIRVLTEDGYRKLTGESETYCGDVVVYRDGKGEVSHAGIVIRKNLLTSATASEDALVVLSKWGHEGEYEHNASDVPELCGRPAEYWTDRKG